MRPSAYVREIRDDEDPDAPQCGICGASMVHKQEQWVCLSCGNTTHLPVAPKKVE